MESWNFDVMLLQIDRPVRADLPRVTLNSDPSRPRVGDTVSPLGLGRLAEVNGQFPENLQKVNVRVVDSDTCNKDPMYPGWIQDSMVCAGTSFGGKDACKYTRGWIESYWQDF